MHWSQFYAMLVLSIADIIFIQYQVDGYIIMFSLGDQTRQ